LQYYDVWGSAATQPHMAVGWVWAFDTPFKWTKQVASHFGGTRQGMAIAWPNQIKDAGGLRTQFHHIIDIVPTILEAAGILAPQMLNGVAQKPIEGVSMAYTWDKANASAPSARDTQYFEMWGNRAVYHDGWMASTTPPEPPWLMGTKPMPDVVNGYTRDFQAIHRHIALVAVTYSLLRAAQHDHALLHTLQQQIKTKLDGSAGSCRRQTQAQALWALATFIVTALAQGQTLSELLQPLITAVCD